MTVGITVTFAVISCLCCVIMLAACINFVRRVYSTKSKNSESLDPLVRNFATVSLFGYAVFVFISFILDIISSLYYIPALSINYTKLSCQLHTFTIVFFMTGKLSMYFFFMSLVHIAFRDSFLSYSTKLLSSIAIGFFIVMCILGIFYMICLFLDFQHMHSIQSPRDCLRFNISTATTVIIWIFSTFDALWSFTCLLLFYLRLRKIVAIMAKQKERARADTLQMEEIVRGELQKRTSNVHVESNYNLTAPTTPDPDTSTCTEGGDIEIECAYKTTQSGDMLTVDRVRSVSVQQSLGSIKEDVEVLARGSSDPGGDTDNGQIEEAVTASWGSELNSPSHAKSRSLGDIEIHEVELSAEQKRKQYKKDRQERTTSSIFESLQMNLSKMKRRISISTKRRKRKKPDVVHKFLPILLKLSILSAWCALSTVVLGFGLWTIYPTLSSVIDSTINAICVYLSFGFTKNLYEVLCLPFISCRNCDACLTIVKEADQMEKDSNYETQAPVL